ncbi:MAG TPA: bifunctional oligoribonuclease/PAP phosphatase NrnA [Syntrophomonadaceae bacterium]|nr:bifunctional oligoribonuclease/PAP phosphatase NrnA [Syntrophomonadaceae bacterium]
MTSLQEIAKQLHNRDNFLLIGHSIPDGDCIGSILGLYTGLTLINKKVTMLIHDTIPSIYDYLPNIEKVSKKLPVPGNIENIIFLDCADKGRVNPEITDNINQEATIFNIDHHASNTFFGDYNYVDIKASAAAEIIYELLVKMDIAITKTIAKPLYAGIIMDTGSFKFNNTTSKTHQITAALISAGADVAEARINLFESKPLKEVLLLGKALRNFNISENNKVAWMQLYYADIDEIGAHGLHPEGIIDYTRMIDGVEVGLVFREIEPGLIKIGFRSKRDIDVSLIAKEFGGGGHKQAAGASLEGDMQAVVSKVLELVEKEVS